MCCKLAGSRFSSILYVTRLDKMTRDLSFDHDKLQASANTRRSVLAVAAAAPGLLEVLPLAAGHHRLVGFLVVELVTKQNALIVKEVAVFVTRRGQCQRSTCSSSKRELTVGLPGILLEELLLIVVGVILVVVVVAVGHVDEHVHDRQGANDGDRQHRALLPRAGNGGVLSLVSLGRGGAHEALA
jgi:hypothetical protein